MSKVIQDSTAQLSDEEIISKVLTGRQGLYEHIMRRYNPRLYRIGMSIVNNDTEVEDIMQSVYIKVFENLHLFEKRSSFSTWITRFMINESLQQLRKNKRYMNMELNDEHVLHSNSNHSENTPVKTLLNKELNKALENALVQLPEKYRIVFVLREMEDMSITETGDTLNISEANVKVRLNRAKTMLRDSLSSYYKNDSIYHFHLSRCNRIVNNVLNHLGIQTVN